MYSNCAITSFKINHNLFSRIFATFNEMEMEINVNNKIFTKLYLKIRVRGK